MKKLEGSWGRRDVSGYCMETLDLRWTCQEDRDWETTKVGDFSLLSQVRRLRTFCEEGILRGQGAWDLQIKQ